MPARKTNPKVQTTAQRTLRTTMNALIGARIDFKVHYPTKNSMVITADNDLNQVQLRTFVEQGGAFGPGKNLMILVPDLGGDNAK
jgi:hypothetical protein